MEKKVGDITIRELKQLCESYSACKKCPIYRQGCINLQSLFAFADDYIALPNSTKETRGKREKESRRHNSVRAKADV